MPCSRGWCSVLRGKDYTLDAGTQNREVSAMLLRLVLGIETLQRSRNYNRTPRMTKVIRLKIKNIIISLTTKFIIYISPGNTRLLENILENIKLNVVEKYVLKL